MTDYDIIFGSLVFMGFFTIVYYYNTERMIKGGEVKKKAKRCSSYLNSFIHANLSVGTALVVLYKLRNNLSNLNTFVPIYRQLAPLTLGYFAQDTMHLLSENNLKQNGVYLFHHLFFGYGAYWVLSQNSFHGLSAIMTLSEISTIFLDIFQYYKYQKDCGTIIKYNRLSNISFVLFGSTFFVFRMIGVPIAIWYYWDQIMMYRPELAGIMGVSMVLNGMWMFKIGKMASKKLRIKNQ